MHQMFFFHIYREHLLLPSFPTRRSSDLGACLAGVAAIFATGLHGELLVWLLVAYIAFFAFSQGAVIWVYISERSEEHTSELQSLTNLVCRLLLEKKKIAMRLLWKTPIFT